jgi:GT2 family glycosyltransferase
MSNTPRTTIVTVCYNSTAVLPAMLASVPDGVPVILVDNASSDALTRMAEQATARLISNEENRGFGAACNQGAAAAETEFILFLNPDASLETDALAALEAAMDRYPTAVALNPRIADGKGRPYFKHRSVLLPRHACMPRGWPEADREVTVLSGAALMVRRTDFEAVGGFDPAIFLYHEDDDLSLRLRATRGSLMFIREAAVRHQEGRSTVRSPETAAFKAWHMGRSRVYAMRKHRRPMARAQAIASAVMQLISPSTWFSRRRFAKQRAFLRGVLSA